MAPTFAKITPSLPVTSIPDAIQYYTEILGFRIAGRDGDNHTWLHLASNQNEDKAETAVNLYLRRRTFPNIPNDVPFGKVHIRVEGVEDELEQLFTNLKARGAKVLENVTKMPWGLKHFTLTDLDGNILNFDQVVAGREPASRT